MDHEFWHNAWAKSTKPGWQQASANEQLIAHWRPDGKSVFVPLCGRSPDLAWLRAQGHTVVGAELSESAVAQFFAESRIDYTIESEAGFQVFNASGYRIYVGDYYELTSAHLIDVTRVYDRAALVAMPPEKRPAYTRHMQKIVPPGAEIFAILIDYEQSKMNGPPFSVPPSELQAYYGGSYDIATLAIEHGDLARRGLLHLVESTYRLTPK